MSEPFGLRYVPSGATIARFHKMDDRVRFVMGPIGSGKTSGMLMEMLYRAVAQAPSTIDGVRKTRFGVIRDTYPNLEKTTIPSWHEWVPRGLGEWNGGPPPSHKFKIDVATVGPVSIEVEFKALGDHRIEDVMRGWQGTAVYINEADRLTPDVLTYVRGRTGRYPPKMEGGCTWRGVWGDLNAPDTENWVYKKFVEEPREGYQLLIQPSGLSPAAENVRNLPAGYYEENAKGQPDWWVRRFIRNEWGYSRDGLPVYTEFNDALHVAAVALRPIRDLAVIVGLDAGLTPAATFWQRLGDGQWRCYRELTTEHMGATRFGERVAQILAETFPGMQVVGWADPAAQYGADREGGEKTWIEIVAEKAQIRIKPAPSNGLVARLEAVRAPLMRLIDGHAPGLLIDPSCKALRKGFNASYRYRRIQAPGAESYSDQPEKNGYSHVHDAAQYALLGGGEWHEVTGRRAARQQHRSQVRAASDYDELGA